MRLALVDELLKRNPVPLPRVWSRGSRGTSWKTKRGRMQLQMKLLQDQRKEDPEAKFTMPTPEQLVQAAQAEAVRNLSIEFVMMALADKEKVEITDADVDTHLGELAKERDKNVARVKAELQREDPGLQQLRAQLRLEKALDVLGVEGHHHRQSLIPSVGMPISDASSGPTEDFFLGCESRTEKSVR